MTVHAALWRGYETEAWLLQPRPPLVPTAEQVQAALAGRYGVVSRTITVRHVTRGGSFLGDLTHAWIADRGYLECDNSRAVIIAGYAYFDADKMPPYDSLHALQLMESVVIRPPGYTEPVTVELPIGLYRPAFAEVVHPERHGVQGPASPRPILEVRLQDASSWLVGALLDDAVTVPAGTPYFAAVADILDGRNLRHALPTGVPGTRLPYDLPPGANEWVAAAWLAYGVNHYPPYPDRNGIVRTRERIAPAAETPHVHYTDSDEGVRMVVPGNGVRVPLDRVARRNVVVAKQEDPRRYEDGVLEDYGMVAYENRDPSSPVSIGYGSPPRPADLMEVGYDTGPGADDETPRADLASTRYVRDTETLRAIARHELLVEATLAETLEIETFVDPRREAHEYYRVSISGVAEGQLYRVLGWRRDFGRNLMRHRLARVDPVTLTEVQ